jgi:hypothetical protein
MSVPQQTVRAVRTGLRLARGQCYLLHIEPPLAHARHYLGWVEGNLPRPSIPQDIEEHLRGVGSPLIRAAIAQGSKITLARVWVNTGRPPPFVTSGQGFDTSGGSGG